MIADTKLHYRPKSKNCHKCNWNMSLIGTGVKRWCCLTSVAYVGPKSRTERPRKTKIGTEVAHVTRDSDTAFKVKGQGHQAALVFTHRGVNASSSCRGDRGKVLTVGTYCYVAVCRWSWLGCAKGFSARRGRGGVGHIVAAVRLQLVMPRPLGRGIKLWYCLTSVCLTSVWRLTSVCRVHRE